MTPESGDNNPSSQQTVKQRKIKDSNTRKALLACLPRSRTDLEEAVSKTETWWRITQYMHHNFGGFDASSTFSQFADFATKTENPVILGLFLVCLASSGQEDEAMYISTVSALIVYDDEYAANIDGIECMALVGKYHADMGQPRKSWMVFRRAAMFAQLMGLPRFHSSSARKDGMFWHLFESDRYLSLLLGLPYTLIDAHCDTNQNLSPGDSITNATRFRRSISVLAGKVVDRNQGVSGQSYSTALDLDQELDDLAAKMGSQWWNLAEEPASESLDDLITSHEERISQITFYLVKMNLHLPFMLKTATNPRYEFSRNACFDAAKRGLQTYLALQSNFSKVMRTFYDCQVIDFIGFTNAVVFLLGLLGYGRAHHQNGQFRNSEDEADWQLIDKAIEILRDYVPSRQTGVTQQCYQTLNFLRGARDCDGDCGGKIEPIITIPYFGTLKIGKSKFAEIAKQRSLNSSMAPTPDSQNGCNVQQMPTPPDPQPRDQGVPSCNDPLISYNGFYMPELDNFNFDISQGDGRFGGAALDSGSGWWQTNANADIDQDWNYFTNGC
ncbi:MAG: hypothetical protein M1822_003657 [Bathelium mastoideum]|nr:MAG: hypothetical protein M1822_003657 [Bathelium mastoideum]